MKIIFDLESYPTISSDAIVIFGKLITSILQKRKQIEEIIKDQRKHFPDDKWIRLDDIDIHFYRQCDGSARSKNLIHIHYINLKPTAQSLLYHFVAIK